VLFLKRLEHGAFRWPPISNGMMRLTASQLAALVDGMDWSRLYTQYRGVIRGWGTGSQHAMLVEFVNHASLTSQPAMS
jgi:hypothetical protein